MSRFAIIFFLLTGCVSSSYNLSSERPIKPSGARYSFDSLKCLNDEGEDKLHQRGGSIFELTESGLYEAALEDGLANYLGDPGELDSILPLKIKVTPSGLKKDPCELSAGLCLLTLGVFPWFSGFTETYDVAVRSPQGKGVGTFKIESKTWQGWIPIFCPYPASADLRGKTWEFNPEGLFARGVARTAINVANTLVTEGSTSPFGDDDEFDAQAEDKYLTISGFGSGRDALDKALRDVMQKAVDSLTDYRWQVRNEKLIRDQFISKARVYIESYERINDQQPGRSSGGTIRITAQVKRKELSDRLAEYTSRDCSGSSGRVPYVHERPASSFLQSSGAASGGDKKKGSTDKDTISVTVKGSGINQDDALKNAYVNAIGKAVGTYIDSALQVENDEVLKDQILTHANAYIEKWEYIDDPEFKNGTVTVEIKAEIRRGALIESLGESRSSKSARTSTRATKINEQLSTIHAQSVTDRRRSSDGAELLAKKLEDFDLCSSLYEIELASNKGTVIQNKDGFVTMSYQFKVSVDIDKYLDECVPYLDAILTQVSAEEPKIVDCARKCPNAHGRWAQDETQLGKWTYSRKHMFELVCDCVDYPAGDNTAVFMIIEASDDLSKIKAKRYILDPACSREYEKWAARIKINPKATVRFTDKAGTTILADQLDFYGVGAGGSSRWGAYPSFGVFKRMRHWHWQDFGHRNTRRGCLGLHALPWIEMPQAGNFVRNVYRRFEFKLAEDDLPKVTTIRVEKSEQ